MGSLIISLSINVFLSIRYDILEKICGLWLSNNETQTSLSFETSPYVGRTSLFRVLNYPDSVDFLFLGDSHTERADFYSLFPDCSIVSQGIGGDITAGLLNRLRLTEKVKPKYIVLEIGCNDLIKGKDVEELINNYRQIVLCLKAIHPESVIIVETIYPVTKSVEDNEEWSITLNKIKQSNVEIKKLAEDNRCQLLDTYNLFSDNDGYLKELYSCDGLHLSGDAYLLLHKALTRIIEQTVEANK